MGHGEHKSSKHPGPMAHPRAPPALPTRAPPARDALRERFFLPGALSAFRETRRGPQIERVQTFSHSARSRIRLDILRDKEKQRNMALPLERLWAEVSTWKFGQPSETNGVKNFPISCKGDDVTMSIQGVLCPFDASSYTDGARRSLTLQLPKILDAPVGLMETAVLQACVDNSARFFGTKRRDSEVSTLYKPLSRKNGEYPRSLRCKIQDGGYYASRFWDQDRNSIEPPSDFSNTRYNVIIRVRSLWVSEQACGLTADISDFQECGPSLVACPF